MAIKIVRSLSVLGGRKELKALKTVRGVHHPNLCPLFGFWTKDADGRFLEDGETEELTFDTLPEETPPTNDATRDTEDSQALMGTMALGQHQPPAAPQPEPAPEPSKPKVTAEQLIVVMGLGDCTLFDRLRYVRQEAGIAPEDENTCYGLEAAEAIRYLKASASAIDLLNVEHQIYHCDIKPQNILLVGGEAQVCDFGLAKRIEGDMRQTQQAFATPAYAPPEVLHNEGYSRWVDQYSLAVTYYELRTGLLPFDITTHANMLVAKATGRLDLTALLPAERKVMQKALHRTPDQRYESCTAFISALAVASGVEKGGGITAKRLMAAVAALLLVGTLGMGSWWQFAPESFSAVFFSSAVRDAGRLSDTKVDFLGTEGIGFESSYNTLDRILEKTAEVVEAPSNAESETEALSLFAQAATRLVLHAHAELNSSEVTESLLEIIEKELNQFSVASGESDPIGKTLGIWSNTTDVGLQSEYEAFQTALFTGKMRLAFRTGASARPEDAARMRASLDANPKAFEKRIGGLTRASLLPLFDVLRGESADNIEGERWLTAPLVEDVLRAQRGVEESPPQQYDERWREIRSAFTLASSNFLSGSRAGDVSADVRDRVFLAFPRLHLDSVVMRMRSSAEAGRWGEVDSLRAEISRSDLSDQQRVLVEVLEAFGAYTGQRDEFVRVTRRLREAGPEFEDLSLRPAMQAYLEQFADRTWREIQQDGSPADIPPDEVFWIERELLVTVPERLYASMMVRHLADQRSRLSAEDLTRCLERIESDDWSGLRSAVRVETAISGESVLPSRDLQQALSSMTQSGDSSWTAPSWLRAFLLCGGSALQTLSGERVSVELNRQSQMLHSQLDSDDFRRLGSERATRLVGLCVQAAVKSSGVPDDDFLQTRYASQSERDVASRLLSFGERWQQASGTTSKKLAAETFLVAIAGRQNSGDERIKIPDALRGDIERGTLEGYSIPFLKSLVQFGIEELKANPNSMACLNGCVVRPAAALLRHASVPVFGQDGRSNEKQTIFRDVLQPCAEVILRNSTTGVSGDLHRELVAAVDAASAKSVCLAHANATHEMSLAESSEIASFESRRTAARVAALAATDSSLNAKQRQFAWLVAAHHALQDTEMDAEEIRFAVAQARRVGPANPETALLESRVLLRAADQSETKRPLLEDALQILETELRRLGQEGEARLNVLYTIHSDAASLGVKIAFEQKENIPDKETKLNRALNHAVKAEQLSEAGLPENDLMVPRVRPSEVYLSKGNALEDLAFYCGLSGQIQQQHYDDAQRAFRKALALADGPKIRFSLARCLYRHAKTTPDTRLMEEAQRSFGKEPTDPQLDPNIVGEWYLWRIQVEIGLGNLADYREFAGKGFAFAEDERCRPNLRNPLAQFYAFSIAVNKEGREEAIAVLLRFLDVAPKEQRTENLSLITQMIVKYGDMETRLKDVMEGLRRDRSVTFSGSSDDAKPLSMISAFCVRDLLKGPGAKVSDTTSMVNIVSATTERVEPKQGRHGRLATEFGAYVDNRQMSASRAISFARRLESTLAEIKDKTLQRVVSECIVMALFPALDGRTPAEVRRLLGSDAEIRRFSESLENVRPKMVRPDDRASVGDWIELLEKAHDSG
ncbi:MAG: protein kinase [Planctomycetota bacterium]